MTLKPHILTALREQAQRWEELLLNLSEAQITEPRFDLKWSIQDVVAHLWGWQQISIARLQAAALDRKPEFPAWLYNLPGDWEEDVDRTNAWLYQNNHANPWSQVHQNWREGYLQMIASADPITEKHLLDKERFTWLNGYSPLDVLIGSYEHHQEHYEMVIAAIKK
jgi:hypothetical protein